MLLSSMQIETALNLHGVAHRETPTGIEALDVATITNPATGEITDASAWVPAPNTRQGMRDFLGY